MSTDLRFDCLQHKNTFACNFFSDSEIIIILFLGIHGTTKSSSGYDKFPINIIENTKKLYTNRRFPSNFTDFVLKHKF